MGHPAPGRPPISEGSVSGFWRGVRLPIRAGLSHNQTDRLKKLIMSTNEKLSEVLSELARSNWASEQRPVLLSNLPPLLLEKLPDYKDILGDLSLKAFIKSSESDSDYRLIEHPTQKAKLALLPKEAVYEFPKTTGSFTATKSEKNGEKALIDFLRALKELPPSDLAGLQIPVHIMVKLLK